MAPAVALSVSEERPAPQASRLVAAVAVWVQLPSVLRARPPGVRAVVWELSPWVLRVPAELQDRAASRRLVEVLVLPAVEVPRVAVQRVWFLLVGVVKPCGLFGRLCRLPGFSSLLVLFFVSHFLNSRRTVS
jgi:hypothetical protein